MNKIERALVTRAKALLFEYAAEELERVKKELLDKKTETLLNVFNSGILLDLNKLKSHGIGRLLTLIETQKKRNKKE